MPSFDWNVLILAMNKDRHKISNKLILVRMETETYNGEKVLTSLGPSFFKWIFFILAGNKDNHKSLDEFKFCSDPTTYYRVSCPECLKIDENVVTTLVPSFLNGSSSFLQVTTTTTKT